MSDPYQIYKVTIKESLTICDDSTCGCGDFELQRKRRTAVKGVLSGTLNLQKITIKGLVPPVKGRGDDATTERKLFI
ncbi:hypothetical protein JRQ81_011235 [Phrynocephalus forsythii]|uniref:Uncharacterized protein n=1 Tax=Phrynocephalus forsythii TaxID=171643 RepID=A0A9Q1AQX0_9SAUR|nr:hypothetical protein JRQ81_011235 [Phrynocephalus forsythii]